MTKKTTLVAKVLLALLLLVLQVPAWAAKTSMQVAGVLRPAGSESARGADPAIYNHYTSAAQLGADPDRPHLGTALTYAGSGPQVAVSAIRVFMHSQINQVHERIRVEVKFWNAHGSTSSPVFAHPPAASLVGIELVGPYILAAGQAYTTTVELPEPVLLDATASTGISVHVLVGAVGDEELREDPGLLPAYNTGSASAVGTTLASYAELGGLRTDHNFAPTDVWTNPLAITLYGRAERMVQCGNWPGYANRVAEEFDDANGFALRWALSANGGNAVFAHDGSFTIANTAPGGSFPYVRSLGTPIPPTGEFSVRWRARYLSVGPNGTGTLVVSRGTPANAGAEAPGTRAAWAWQDAGSYRAFARATAGADPTPAFQEPAGSAIHDVEYCWLAGSVELWVDGSRVLQQSRAADVQRPDSLWFGNNVSTGDPGGIWNPMRLYRLHVRVPFSDRIFAHGFEAMP